MVNFLDANFVDALYLNNSTLEFKNDLNFSELSIDFWIYSRASSQYTFQIIVTDAFKITFFTTQENPNRFHIRAVNLIDKYTEMEPRFHHISGSGSWTYMRVSLSLIKTLINYNVNSIYEEKNLDIFQQNILPSISFSYFLNDSSDKSMDNISNFPINLFYLRELRLFNKFFTVDEKFLKNKKLDLNYRNLIYYNPLDIMSKDGDNLKNFKNNNITEIAIYEIISDKSLINGNSLSLSSSFCNSNKFLDENSNNCTLIPETSYNKSSCEIPLDNKDNCLQCNINFILHKNKCITECPSDTTLINTQCIENRNSTNTTPVPVKYSYKTIVDYLTEVKPLVNITLVDLEFFIKSQSRTIINENVSLFNISKFNFQIEKNYLVINHLEKAIAKTKFIPNKLYNIIIENDNSNKTINVSIDRNTYYTAYINQNFILDFSTASMTDFQSQNDNFRVFVDSIKLYSKISYKTVIFFYRYKRLFPDDGDKYLVYQKRNLFTLNDDTVNIMNIRNISSTIISSNFEDEKKFVNYYVNKCQSDEYLDDLYNVCKKCPKNCESCYIDTSMNLVLCRLCKEDKFLFENKCIDLQPEGGGQGVEDKKINFLQSNFYNNGNFPLTIENNNFSSNSSYSYTIFFSIKILESFKSSSDPYFKHTLFYLSDDIKIDVTILSNTICMLELIQLSNKFNPILISFSIADFYLSWSTYIFSFENLEDSLYNINIFISDSHLIKNLRRDLGFKFTPRKIHTSNSTSFALSEYLILNKYSDSIMAFYEKYFKDKNFVDNKWVLVLKSTEKKLIELKTGIEVRDNIFYEDNIIEKIICQNGFYFNKIKGTCQPCNEACSTCFYIDEVNPMQCSKCNYDKGYFNLNSDYDRDISVKNHTIQSTKNGSLLNLPGLNCTKICGLFKIGNRNLIESNECVDFPYIDFLNIENFYYEINLKEKIFNDITVDLWVYSNLKLESSLSTLSYQIQSNFIDINNQLILSFTPSKENLRTRCEYRYLNTDTINSNPKSILNEKNFNYDKWNFLRCSIKSNRNLLHFNNKEVIDGNLSNFKIENIPYIKFKQFINQDNEIINSLIFRNLNIWSIFLKYESELENDFSFKNTFNSIKYLDVNTILFNVNYDKSNSLLIFSKNFDSSTDIEKKFFKNSNYINRVSEDFLYLPHCNRVDEYFDVETSKCEKLIKFSKDENREFDKDTFHCETEISGTQICLKCKDPSNFILSEAEVYNNFKCIREVNKCQYQPGKYFDVHTGICKNCHPNCLTCYGNSATQCLSCAKSFLTENDIFNRNQCNYKCADGEFYDIKKKECINGKIIF